MTLQLLGVCWKNNEKAGSDVYKINEFTTLKYKACELYSLELYIKESLSDLSISYRSWYGLFRLKERGHN